MRKWLAMVQFPLKLVSLTGTGIAVCLSSYTALPHDWANLHIRLVMSGLLGGVVDSRERQPSLLEKDGAA